MKRLITLIAASAMVCGMSAETVFLANPGKLKQNVLAGSELGADVPDGFSLKCMNEEKNLESGNEFTIDDVKYRAIKFSNGAQNTLTLPSGCVAKKVTFYTTINKDAATDRPCYWAEVAGVTYNLEDNHGIIESFKDYANPNIQSFDIPDLNSFTFKNTGEQPFCVIEVTYESEGGSADAPTFQWTQTGMNPYPGSDIISMGSLGTVGFQVYEVEGVAITDVMPVWVDEDGNEIKAVSGEQDPWGWNANEFRYTFDTSAFKANGEYILLFPEGMLVNAAGEKSAKVEIPYSVEVPELAPAMFDDFEVLSINPDLSQPQAIWNDQLLTINTNHNNAIGLTKLTITDVTTGDIVCTSSSFTVGRQLGEDSEISWEVAGPYKFYEEHTYRADIVFYNGVDEQDYETGVPTKVVDRISYEFTGRVEAYKYSAVTLESVTPAPGAYVISDPSQAVFTYTFSGPVTVYKAYTPMGQNGQYDYPAAYLSSNEEKTEWTLDLSESEFIQSLDAALPISIRVRDNDGYQLQGNFGEEALSAFEYEWECEIGAPAIEIVVPAYDTAVEKLTEVVVKSVSGASMSYQGYPAAIIQTRDRLQLGELYLDFDVEAGPEVRFTKWTPAGELEPQSLETLAEGIYSIFFPHGAFMFGEQFESKQSHSAGTSFEISGSAVTPPSDQATFAYVSADPASGSTVTSLEKIVIAFPDVAALTEWTIDVYKEGEAEPVAVADLEFDPEDWNAIDVNFRAPITADGTYTLTFKEGVICDDAFDMSGGTSGTCNPEFTLTYTVSGGSAVVSVEAAEADAVYYDLSGRRVLNPNKGIYIVNGKKVVK